MDEGLKNDVERKNENFLVYYFYNGQPHPSLIWGLGNVT